MWLRDVRGNLINLARCEAIIIHQEDQEGLFLVKAHGMAGEPATLFGGTIGGCRSFIDRLEAFLVAQGAGLMADVLKGHPGQ